MSDEEKKNGEYEKPESHEMGGNDLEDISGGTGGESGGASCSGGSAASRYCQTGSHAGAICKTGDAAGQECRSGTSGR